MTEDGGEYSGSETYPGMSALGLCDDANPSSDGAPSTHNGGALGERTSAGAGESDRGSGLGLSTSLAIVKSHGGSIHVTARKGTTFQVFLPAQIATDSPQTPPLLPGMPPGNGELILVVDDEEPMRRMMQHILAIHGYRFSSLATARKP